VDEDVSHGYDVGPGNIRMLFLQGIREVVCGLTYDLKVIDDPGLDKLIFEKGVSAF
jgi:hypothetical protein